MTATIDTIINELAKGTKLSSALQTVYTKRKVSIPYKKEWFDADVRDLKMSTRTTCALIRAHIVTINDLMDYISFSSIKEIRNIGTYSCVEIMEKILDHAWECMNEKEKAEFLIDIVARNQHHLKS